MRTQQPPPEAGPSELDAAVDRLWPGYQSVLAGLVQIPSLSGAESGAQQYLAAAAAEAGLDAEQIGRAHV